MYIIVLMCGQDYRIGGNLEKSINKIWLKIKCDNISKYIGFIKLGMILHEWI